MLTILIYTLKSNYVTNMFILEPSAEVIQVLSEYLGEDAAYDVFHACCDHQGLGSKDFCFEHLPEFLYDLVNRQEMYDELSKVQKWEMFDKLAQLSNRRSDGVIRIAFACVPAGPKQRRKPGVRKPASRARRRASG
jgi:hypothetical protein